MDDQSWKIIAGELFTDRGHGEGLVLSEYTSGSWRKSKHIKAHRIDFCGIRRMKSNLFCMCKNVDQFLTNKKFTAQKYIINRLKVNFF